MFSVPHYIYDVNGYTTCAVFQLVYITPVFADALVGGLHIEPPQSHIIDSG